MSLGDYIHDLRVEADYSIRELAERCGCSPTHIHDIEHDRRDPSLEIIHELAVALNASEDELTAMAGKLATDVEAWMRETPAVGKLLALMAFWQIDDDQIQKVIDGGWPT